MYSAFFQLKQAPFSSAPDPRYLFMSERHREALAHLLYGVGSGGGFVLLTGEIGAGKTTVCRCFIEQIPADCKLAYIFNPRLSVAELLLSICEEFGIEPAAGQAAGVKTCVDAINGYLLHSHAQGHNNVLIIDEAQNLSADVLEQLRLLTNLETNERKLLQIILIGQPELRAMLARPDLEQLAQRVIARYHLGSLAAAETASYIGHRLAVAGGAGQTPFSRRRLAQIYRISQGVPRRINLLCDRALLGAYVENRHQVTPGIVRKAAAEVFARQASAGAPRWLHALAGAVAGVLITAAVWRLLPQGAPAPAVAAAPAIPAPALRFDAAVRQLAAVWGQDLAGGEPCQAAANVNLRCHRGKGGLAELRVLDLPAVLSLHDDAYALLTGLSASTATLRVNGKDQNISLAALGLRFDGEFLALWRAPRGWRDAVTAGDRGPDVDWLGQRLAQWGGVKPAPERQPLDAAMQRVLRQFQLSQQLAADGVAGPKTFIRLMQIDAVTEPRLRHAVAAKQVAAAPRQRAPNGAESGIMSIHSGKEPRNNNLNN